jgi:mannose-6-phosphate isomerase
VLVSLLMNHITLRPGEAIYLPAGNLHAYLSGVGVEIMASSDNVLRGGLTGKHVDVPELMRVLDFSPGDDHRVSAVRTSEGEWTYPTPTTEFLLSRIELSAQAQLSEHTGAQILLAVSGELIVTEEGGGRVTVPSGHSLFVPARQQRVWISGSGTAFRARDGIRDEILELAEDRAA